MALHLRIEGAKFRDSKNREITIHGVNVAGDAKQPSHPDQPSHEPKDFFNGDNVSFVGRPFPLEEAPVHFGRLRKWGYNTIRYIFTWEAIEAKGPGKYDEQWIQHTISVLREAKRFGFYVFMDPHQDVWSRFTGGSGAPMWTIYACGLDPQQFNATEAAVVQNTFPKPEEYPKMIWATSYYRLACQLILTMFWGGKKFTPYAIIDGINIQDYLQNHFIGACKHLAMRIKEAGDLDKDVVIGWESMNEPNRGLIGLQDLTKVPSEQKLQKGTSPTAWQAMLTGSGRACEIETWDVGSMGPYKTGSKLVDPKGQVAWLSPDYDDSRYGWTRDPKWKLGTCLWAQHGVWDQSTDTLLENEYFARDPETGQTIDYPYFTQHYFMAYYRKYRDAVREIFPDTFMLCQPPTLELPPSIKNTSDDDPNMIYAPHWYDGLTLMTKKWNRWWNVDVYGVLRGKYWSPAFAIKIGETAIRNCFRDQLVAIRQDGTDRMGTHPCIFTELGVPFDMENGKAYKDGDYTSQTLAMDANHFAVEGGKQNFTLWTYVANNDHRWGDQWNGEDLSIYSKDDPVLELDSPTLSLDPSSPSFSQRRSDGITKGAVYSSSTESMTAEESETESIAGRATNEVSKGYRAAEAFVRPTPVATVGNVVSFGFDINRCEFKLALDSPAATKNDTPTEIFLPDYHFPKDCITVTVSGGKWEVISAPAGGVSIQLLRWWHAAGEQNLTVQGTSNHQSSLTSRNPCPDKSCRVM